MHARYVALLERPLCLRVIGSHAPLPSAARAASPGAAAGGAPREPVARRSILEGKGFVLTPAGRPSAGPLRIWRGLPDDTAPARPGARRSAAPDRAAAIAQPP